MKHATPHILFLGPIWICFTIFHVFTPLFVSREFFCSSAWECNGWIPFYVWDRPMVGDMGRMAGPPQLKIRKHQYFSLDEYGFRNPVGQYDKGVDFVLIGQSFGGGSQLSDHEHFIRRVEHKTGLVGYNYSIRLLQELLGDERFINKTPKLIILFFVEGYLRQNVMNFDPKVSYHHPGKAAGFPAHTRTWPELFKQLQEQVDKPSILSKYAEDVYKGSLFQLGLYKLDPSIVCLHDKRTGMLFFNEFCNESIHQNFPEVDRNVGNIVKFRNAFAARGIQTLVIFLPRKEEFYKQLSPKLQHLPDFVQLNYAHKKLAEHGVVTIRAHDILREYERNHPEEWLYFLDDTHMAPLGHEVLAEATYEKILSIVRDNISP